MGTRTGRLLEDGEIVELYWQRNEEAITASEQKYGNYCTSVAMNILQDYEDSKECVNDTWMHAWNSMPPHRPELLRMFLAKITRGAAWNLYKAKHAEKRGGGQISMVLEELEECLPGKQGVEESILAKELGMLLQRFVLELPEKERNVFVRRYFFTESITEIANGYGMSENYCMVMLCRARKRLREKLVQEGYGGEGI